MNIFVHSFRQRLMLFAACAVVGGLMPVASSLAQTAPAAPDAAAPSESIVVTGSRLKHSDVTSEAPVTIVTSAEIRQSGAQTIEDVLQRITAIGTAGTYRTANNGGDGVSCTDLRNLGLNRVLVLVNGKRFVRTQETLNSCVDLNNIPIALVDRVEVDKTGASSVYGADAVAGVINIILKKNFTGTTINVNGGIASAGDNRTGEINVTTGANFDRGNVTFSAGYQNIAPVEQKDRDWAHYVVTDNTIRKYLRVGSAIALGGQIFDAPNTGNNAEGLDLLGQDGGTTKPFQNCYALPASPNQRCAQSDRFNWGDRTWLLGAQEKWNLASTVNYEITPSIEFYGEGYYTHNRTQQQLAPYPVTGSYPGDPVLPTDFIVPQGNPFAEALGIDEDVAVYKRLNELGNRKYIQNSDTFQFRAGFKGPLIAGWDYDVYFNYGRASKTETEYNIENYARLEQVVGFRQTNDLTPYINNGSLDSAADGVVQDAGVYDPSVCVAAAGCVLGNPFGPNGLSVAAANYIRVNDTNSTISTLREFGGEVHNDSVYQLPYGPLGVVLGVAHRREEASFTPDSVVQSGVTSNPPIFPTAGGFDVTEVFGETQVPLLANLPFAKDLHVTLAGRYFDYNTFGNGETWNVGANWTPVKDFRIRATIGTGFRQPTVNDLFGGGTVSYNSASDPCSNPGSANAVANCAAQGATGVQNVNGQVPTLTGVGNPKLQPETSRTWTVGIVFTPSFLPNLTATVDYYHTRIAQSIGVVDTQTILDNCYDSANLSSPFCADILPRSGLKQLTLVNQTTLNLGETRTDGIDFGLNYVQPLPGAYGSITLHNDATLLTSYTSQNFADGPFITYLGKEYVASGYQSYPRLRDNASLIWAFNNVSVGYRMRYISGMEFYEDPCGDPTQRTCQANEVFYHDIFATYAWRNINATFGIDNVFDRTPPFVPDGTSNTSIQTYDEIGRFIYLKTSVKF